MRALCWTERRVESEWLESHARSAGVSIDSKDDLMDTREGMVTRVVKKVDCGMRWSPLFMAHMASLLSSSANFFGDHPTYMARWPRLARPWNRNGFHEPNWDRDFPMTWFSTIAKNNNNKKNNVFHFSLEMMSCNDPTVLEPIVSG